MIEEAISALVFDYAKRHSFLENVTAIDYELLRLINNLSSHLEIRRCSLHRWEKSIFAGFNAWRQVQQYRGGIVTGDLMEKNLIFSLEN